MTVSPTNQQQTQAHCPSRDQLVNYATGRLPSEAVDVLEGHVGQCFRCQTVMEDIGDLSDDLTLSIREAATGHAGFEDEELYELARRAAAAARQATRDTAETFVPGSSPPDPRSDEDPQRLGQYRLTDKLGQGGMGTVYKALHPKLKREVAIKVLPVHRTGDPQAVERFHREMEAVGRLDHPNIVRAYDAGKAAGRYFLVMELLEGTTLAGRVRSGEPIPVCEACDAIRQAALGIQHAHDHGMIHRDIKPSNLMRLADGSVKVLDLGLAHFQLDLPPEEHPEAVADLEMPVADGITQTGQTIGTLGYMSPEQVLGRPQQLDRRTDVYSLGLTLYELLALRPAFSGTNRRQLLEQIVDEGPRPLRQIDDTIPPELEAIVLKAIARDPADRYTTAQHFADALGEFIRAGGAERPWQRAALLTGAAVCLMVVLGLLWLATGGFRGRPQRPVVESPAPLDNGQQRDPAGPANRLPIAEADDPTPGQWMDLLPEVDLDRDRIRGQWQRNGTALSVAAESAREGFVRLMLPVVVEGSYDLLVEFTRISGNDSVAIALPVGRRTGILHLSAHAGQAGGLERIDDLAVRNPVNPTFKQSSLIENGRRYQVLSRVRTDGDQVSMEILLDDQPYVCWAGKESSLTTGAGWWLPEQRRPALGSNKGEVVFHAARLRVVSGRTSAVGPGEIRRSQHGDTAVRGQIARGGLALSPDRRAVVTCAADGVVQVWDLESDAELYRLDGSSKPLRQACFFADRRHLVTAGGDGIVRRCWDHTGDDLHWFDDAVANAHSVAVSSDGRFLAAGCDGRVLRVWNMVRGEEVYAAEGLSSNVECVSLSPLGGWLLAASAEDPQVYLVELDGRQMTHLKGHESGVVSTACSADGRRFASADRSGTIILWDIEHKKAASRLLGHSGGVSGLAFSAHGRYLLSGGDDGTIRLWDVQTGRQVHRFDDHLSPVRAVGFCSAFSTSGRYAVSGGADGSIRLWRLPEVVAQTDRIPVPDEILVVVPGENLPPLMWVNLLASVDVEEDRVRGDWRREDDRLLSGGQQYSRIMLPATVSGSYDLTAEFTRLSGGDTVCFMLPVGERACRLCLSGWQGAIHGLEDIDGRRINDASNPTARPLGSLVSGRRYHLSVGVRLQGDDARIRASLDGEPLLDFSGKQASLEIPPGWGLPGPMRPALGTSRSPTRFHSVLMRSVAGGASIVKRHDKHREQVPRGQWVDLLAGLDPDTARFDRGRAADEWKRTEDALVADVRQSGGTVSTMLPVIVEGSYQLEVQFTRSEGTDMVAVLLPGGPQGSALVLSDRGGKLSGIDRIDGRDLADNRTCRRPGTLQNGRRYTVLVEVKQEGDLAGVAVLIDGKPYIEWSGRRTSLGIRSDMRLPDPRRPGLAAADNCVTFHSARLRLLSGTATLTAPAATTRDED